MTIEGSAYNKQPFDIGGEISKHLSVTGSNVKAEIGEMSILVEDNSDRLGVGGFLYLNYPNGSVSELSVRGSTDISFDQGYARIVIPRNRSVRIQSNCKGDDLVMKFRHRE